MEVPFRSDPRTPIVDQRDITVLAFSAIWSIATKVLPNQTHSGTYKSFCGHLTNFQHIVNEEYVFAIIVHLR